jgi:hypothetical protein
MVPGTPFAGTSQLFVAPPLTQQPLSSPLQWGPLNVHAHLAYDVSYGNSLQASPGQLVNSVINQVAPGILFNLGSHWSLDYTPTLRFYSAPQLQDGVDQAVNFSGHTAYQDWTFGLFQGYSSSSQPLVETGSQTDQQVYSTALTAGYQMSSKMALDFSLNQNFRFVGQQLNSEPLTDSKEWSTMEWLNYQFQPTFSAGLGLGFTYDDLSIGSDMTSEQFQGRLNWRATEKVSFQVTGGLDYRQFLSSNTPELLSPIYSISAQYQMFETTSLSLAAGSSVSPSYFQDSVSDATTISAGLHQRLLRRLYLDISGGYSTTAYHVTTTVAGPANTSNYDMTSLNVRLNTTLLRRVNAALYFQENFLSSTSGGAAASLYNYTTTQVGLSLGYRF